MSETKYNRIFFPEKNVYIVDNHNLAFGAWERHKQAGKIKPHATLIHVDAHLDDIPDGLLVHGLHTMENNDDIDKVCQNLKIENFIWPAVGLGTIDNVIYISQHPYGDDPFNFDHWNFTDETGLLVKKLLDDNKYNGVRYWNLEEFLAHKNTDVVSKIINNKNLILDLDLDYFNENHIDTFEAKLMEREKVISTFKNLRDLYTWDLVTVALSPLYCGGKQNAEYLLELFFEVFGLKFEDAQKW